MRRPAARRAARRRRRSNLRRCRCRERRRRPGGCAGHCRCSPLPRRARSSRRDRGRWRGEAPRAERPTGRPRSTASAAARSSSPGVAAYAGEEERQRRGGDRDRRRPRRESRRERRRRAGESRRYGEKPEPAQIELLALQHSEDAEPAAVAVRCSGSDAPCGECDNQGGHDHERSRGSGTQDGATRPESPDRSPRQTGRRWRATASRSTVTSAQRAPPRRGVMRAEPRRSRARCASTTSHAKPSSDRRREASRRRGRAPGPLRSDVPDAGKRRGTEPPRDEHDERPRRPARRPASPTGDEYPRVRPEEPETASSARSAAACHAKCASTSAIDERRERRRAQPSATHAQRCDQPSGRFRFRASRFARSADQSSLSARASGWLLS